MKWLSLVLLLLPAIASGQTREVFPGELALEVIVEEAGNVPFEREMVLITIRGVYRRHITRESLQQPDFDGFNWMQLGPDHWSEERIRGQKVKILQRRMALFPERPGRLTIGAFTHELTLTDEADGWFVHHITSAPVTIEVAPAPVLPDSDWWFPVRSLRISDDWSNAPDQLAPGEGVLRVIRLEAVGAAPEMIPPMPELTSPTGMVFAHPEKRLVELSPQGPVTYAFWRWTIRPGNDVSAILEPLALSFYDTEERVAREAVISAQRVAYDTATLAPAPPPAIPAGLPGVWTLLLALLACALATMAMLAGRAFTGMSAMRRFGLFDRLVRALRRAERRGDLKGLRRAVRALARRDGTQAAQQALVAVLDREIHAAAGRGRIPEGFARRFLAARAALPEAPGRQ